MGKRLERIAIASQTEKGHTSERVFHYRHGWIPLDHAEAIKAHRNRQERKNREYKGMGVDSTAKFEVTLAGARAAVYSSQAALEKRAGKEGVTGDRIAHEVLVQKYGKERKKPSVRTRVVRKIDPRRRALLSEFWSARHLPNRKRMKSAAVQSRQRGVNPSP